MQGFLKFPEEPQSSGSLAVRLLAPMCEPGRYQVEGSRGSQQIWGFFLLISMFEKLETMFGLCLGLLDLVNVFLLSLVSS